MEQSESILNYYKITNREIPKDLLNAKSSISHFNILKRQNCVATFPFIRRDYYKICIIDGSCLLYTDQGEMMIDTPYLHLANPDIKHGWQQLSEKQEGYVCLFNEEYLSSDLKAALKKLYASFDKNTYPLIRLERDEYEMFLHYFKLMHSEYHSDFDYKKEVVHNLLRLIIYLGIKIRTAQNPDVKKSEPGDRIVKHFFELLNNQFPVDSPKNSIAYKTASDFAHELHVHVNHLNHCLKTHTGKSTTQIINERIVSEALDLLKNTDWSITEIGDSLGFEYPQYFTLFFKKQTGRNPKYYRMSAVEEDV